MTFSKEFQKKSLQTLCHKACFLIDLRLLPTLILKYMQNSYKLLFSNYGQNEYIHINNSILTWSLDRGLEKWCEWRFLCVVKCSSLIFCPHSIGSPRLQMSFSLEPLMTQWLLTSSCIKYMFDSIFQTNFAAVGRE